MIIKEISVKRGQASQLQTAVLKDGEMAYTKDDNKLYIGVDGKNTLMNIKGEEGDAATIEIGTIVTGAAGTEARVVNRGNQTAAVLDFRIPKGDQGEKGEKGDNGKDGTDGTSIRILGSYESIEELQLAHPTGTAGDTYIVQGELYVWTAEEKSWKNVGRIRADLAPKEVLELLKEVDGIESGLDADLFRGKAPEEFRARQHAFGYNYIINGDFRIWQRGIEFSGAYGCYTADRWYVGFEKNDCKAYRTTLGIAGRAGNEICFEEINTVAAADAYTDMIYRFEDAERVLDFQEAALSFFIKADLGTSVEIYLFYADGDIVRQDCITSELVEKVEMLIDNNHRWIQQMFIRVNRRGWAIGTKCYIADVKLEQGNQVTPFVQRLFAEELALCQRYYEKSYGVETPPGNSENSSVIAGKANDCTWVQGVQWAVRKRVAPTVNIYSTNGAKNRLTRTDGSDTDFDIEALAPSEANFAGPFSATGGFTEGAIYQYHFTADAEI